MNRFSSLLRGLVCLLVGGTVSLVLGIQFFDDASRADADRVFLFAVPALAFAYLLWLALPALTARASKPGLVSGLAAIVPSLLLLALVQPAYAAGWQQMFLAAGFILTFGSLIFLARDGLARGARQFLQARLFIPAAILLLFDGGIVYLALRLPSVFHPEQFLPPAANLPWIGVGLLAGLSALGWTASCLQDRLGAARRAALGRWLETHLPGLYAAAAIFIGSAVLARGFNPPLDGLSLNNTFFASDTYFWQARFGSAEGYPIGRAVHPLALLFLRGSASALAFLLGGNWRLAALTLVPLAAAACVFLMWIFVLRVSGRPTYALLFSALLGLSAAHLVFGSVTETYIFSALGLLLFFVALLDRERPVRGFLLPGLMTLGITVTNAAQSLVGFAVVRRNVREWLRFVGLLLAAGVALTVFTVIVYPRSMGFFFVPSDLLYESRHASRIEGGVRAALVAKNLFLYNVAAVSPDVNVVNKDGRAPFPKFNYFQPPFSLREYFNPYGFAPFILWLILLGAAFVNFARRGRSSPWFSFQLTFLAVLGLNFVMHLLYGFEPFLYTPNWTYALLLFVALSLLDLPKQEWLEWALILLLATLLVNNGLFLRVLGGHLAPFLQ